MGCSSREDNRRALRAFEAPSLAQRRLWFSGVWGQSANLVRRRQVSSATEFRPMLRVFSLLPFLVRAHVHPVVSLTPACLLKRVSRPLVLRHSRAFVTPGVRCEVTRK